MTVVILRLLNLVLHFVKNNLSGNWGKILVGMRCPCAGFAPIPSFCGVKRRYHLKLCRNRHIPGPVVHLLPYSQGEMSSIDAISRHAGAKSDTKLEATFYSPAAAVVRRWKQYLTISGTDAQRAIIVLKTLHDSVRISSF
ncbi:hypothetical protein [Salipiger abyssi]|uniref:hypothetical protein n=1 Tax=Salipiger abyssi TaxID=1250539 RepID=UPI001A8CD437|nr:hypothetical protein [Salipiger abyssi]MBN9886632.1 hypothetical protein [Salipiger abyssi]